MGGQICAHQGRVCMCDGCWCEGDGGRGAGVRELEGGVCEGRRAGRREGQVEGGCNIREYPGICMS